MAAFRQAFTVLAVLTLVLVVLQFFLAGLGLFGASSYDAHEAVGHGLEGVTLLLLIAAAAGRMGRTAIIASAGLLVLVVVQGALPGATDVVAAFHPLVALVIFVGAAQTAMMATGRGRAARTAS